MRALPGLALWCAVPGVALACVAGRRAPWRERLAMAPGLGAGFVGIVGLLYHALHLRFEALTVAPAVAALVLAAALLLRGRPPAPDAATRRAGAGLIAGALAA